MMIGILNKLMKSLNIILDNHHLIYNKTLINSDNKILNLKRFYYLMHKIYKTFYKDVNFKECKFQMTRCILNFS
jgi:hypothetical protein